MQFFKQTANSMQEKVKQLSLDIAYCKNRLTKIKSNAKKKKKKKILKYK